MIAAFLSLYRPSYSQVIVYMLQGSEYRIKPYLQWFWRTKDYSAVMQRRTLDKTTPARLLLLALRLGIVSHIIMGILIMYFGLRSDIIGGVPFGAAFIIIYPVLWAHLVVLPVLLGRWLISGPAEQKLINESEHIFANHPGLKVAIAGSYGKTTMKELLNTVLSQGLTVAATPANKNVSSSHAHFAKKLTGDEDILLIEYGEGAPGDVGRFAQRTHPTHAVITGLAPAHLDQYKTLQAAGEDIFSVAQLVTPKQVYVNADSTEIKPFIKPQYQQLSHAGALGWKVSQVNADLAGTTFVIKKGSRVLKLQSALIGKHQVGFLAFAAAFAFELGLSGEQVQRGLLLTAPFEHRMQPYQLGGAWIVDDTYNGNLEGIRAGTQLLKDLPAKRKIYVTPGLVNQGPEIERVHLEVGKLIAAAQPAIVVLMQNTATKYIQAGLESTNFTGELRLETNPLDFYTNLKHFVASGDLIVMQNDWTDNYA